MIIRDAKDADMQRIYDAAALLDLDSDDMGEGQYIIAEDNGNIAGFGRLIERGAVLELGTIGVLERYRGKGLAKDIIGVLLGRAEKEKDIYLTTLIPGFFEKLGFERLDTPPPQSMIRKPGYCEGCTKIGCTVMRLKR